MAAKKTQARNKAKSESRAIKPGTSVLPLLGKVAVVTGGSRGIGYAIARALAAEGCSVVITGRDGTTLTKSAERITRVLPKAVGPKKQDIQVIAEACDVRDPESVSSLFDKVKRRFGRLDILVNNAGITQPVATVEETSLGMWNDVIGTNLTGTFLCTRAALPLMKAGATIINNLSAAAKQVFPRYATYTASKQGAFGLTLSLREELIPRGIRVTALIPGATATDMWDHIMPDAPREKMIDVESVAQAVLYAVLLPPNANLSELLLDPAGGAF